MPGNNPAEKNIHQFNRDTAKFGGYLYTSTGKVSAKVANDHITQIILSLADIRGKSVFDIGCGDGTYTQELYLQGKPKSIDAIDPAEEAIKNAKKNNSHKQIKFFLGSIYRLPKGKKYDVAIVRGVLHHLYNPAKAIAEVSQVAKLVVVVEPNGYNPVLKVIEKTSPYHLEHEEKSYPPRLIDRWVRKNRGVILQQKYAGLVPFFCPDFIAKLLKKIEPMMENFPLLNRFVCANYYLVYQVNDHTPPLYKWYSFLNSFSQGLSGSDACFLNVASQLAPRQISHTIITSALGRALCQSHHLRANYIITSHEHQFTNVYYAYLKRIFRALFTSIPRENCLLYSTSDILPDVLPAFVPKVISGKRFWAQKIFHLIPSERRIPHLMQLLSFKLINHSADLIIVDNAKLKEQLVKCHRFSARRIIVIPPGVNVSLIRKINKSKQKFDALFIGQFRHSKGIFDLLKIWPLVLSRFPNALLAIIGQDVRNNRAQLKKLIFEKHLQTNIKLLGFVSEKKKYSLIKSSRLLLLPSYEEGFGMVVLEALVCGKTTVAYDLPVFKEHFSGKVVTVPVGDTRSFAQKVIANYNQQSKATSHFQTTYAKFDILKLVAEEINLVLSAYEKKSPR